MQRFLFESNCRKSLYARGTERGVLMTATITPPASAVKRINSEERMQDYANALKFYLGLPAKQIGSILFIDNSNTSLEPLRRLVELSDHSKHVELISFAGNDHPVQWGKVYGEFKLIDFGLKNTNLFGPEEIIWKVTGRLCFLNLASIIEAVPQKFDLLCDLHNIPWVGTGWWWGNHYMDLRAFAFNRYAWNRLFSGRYEQKKADFNWNYLYSVIQSACHELRIVPRFPLQPVFSGYSGRHNRPYDSGMQIPKNLLRNMIRKIAPWLWI